MKVTVLIENTTNSELVSEHGLSFFITFEGKNYLLDAGSSGAFLKNAKAMKIPVFDVVCAILSHGHYDHAGGFGVYLKEAETQKKENIKIYAMEQAVQKYYSASGGTIHEIGIPKQVFPAYQDSFQFINKVVSIEDNVFLIPHATNGLEKIGERAKLYQKVDDVFLPDNFSHELSLVFDTPKGLVIFNSCSHSGLPCIIEEVKNVFPDKRIYAFFGGLHMKGKKEDKEICIFSKEEIRKLAEYLQKCGIKKIFTGHCTGAEGFAYLKEYLGDMVENLETGKQIEILS